MQILNSETLLLFSLCSFHCNTEHADTRCTYLLTAFFFIRRSSLAICLCHRCTTGLPPEIFFYMYIPVGCLESVNSAYSGLQ